MLKVTLGEIAQAVNGELRGDPEQVVTGLAFIGDAGPEHLSFVADTKYTKLLAETQCACVLLPANLVDLCATACVLVHDPYLAYAKASALFTFPARIEVHPSAIIADDVSLGESVSIAPNVCIGAGSIIEDNVIIGAGTVIGENCVIGAGTRLYPNVSCYHDVHIGKNGIVHSGSVLGSDGFGFAPNKGAWEKIHQLGGLRVGDNVEIGANCSIDRGAIEHTCIEEGVKIDNLVHIAHNVVIGAHTAIAGCVGIAGSTVIGKHCKIAGQVGIGGHLTIVDNVTLLAKSMVIKSISSPGTYSSGLPATTAAQWRRNVVRFMQLDKLAKKINDIKT